MAANTPGRALRLFLLAEAMEIFTTLFTATGHVSDWNQPYGITHFGSHESYLEARLLIWGWLLVLVLFHVLAVQLITGGLQNYVAETWKFAAVWLIAAVSVELLTSIGSARFCCQYEESVEFPSLLGYLFVRSLFWVPMALALALGVAVRRVSARR